MKKISLLLATSALSVIAVGAVLATNYSNGAPFAKAEKRSESDPYTITIDSTKKEFHTGGFDIKTELGNTISFSSNGVVNPSTRELVSGGDGLYVYNDVTYSGHDEVLDNLITSITSVTVEFTNNDTENPLSIYAETDYYDENEPSKYSFDYYIFYDDVDEIEIESGVTCEFTGDNLPTAFTINTDSNEISISKITITYLCA